MKLFIALLTFAAVVGLSLAQNGQSDLDGVEDNSMRIGFCGSKLSDVLILVCRPFGGIARRKRGESSGECLVPVFGRFARFTNDTRSRPISPVIDWLGH